MGPSASEPQRGVRDGIEESARSEGTHEALRPFDDALGLSKSRDSHYPDLKLLCEFNLCGDDAANELSKVHCPEIDKEGVEHFEPVPAAHYIPGGQAMHGRADRGSVNADRRETESWRHQPR
jgi:hypothetical protein